LNLNKIQLGRIANQSGFVRDTLEKVIRLTEVLKFVNEDEILSEHLLLKGGTAINLTILELKRLSVDIDLDFTPNLSKEEVADQRAIIKHRLNNYMKKEGYELEEDKSKFTHSLDSCVYSYMNTGDTKDLIKVEINYSIREHIFRSVKCKNNTLNGVLHPLEIKTVHPIEIYGSKLTALMGRSAARDLYDVWNMIEMNLFNREEQNLLRKALIFYSILNVDVKEELFDTSQILTINWKKIHRELRPVIYTKERLELEKMHMAVINYIEALIQLDDRETLFIDEYYDEGDYRPELLFEEKERVERLRTHPMVLWRLNSRQRKLNQGEKRI